MKRLTTQLCGMIVAALFSLMTLATLPDVAETAEAVPAVPGTAFRFAAFAVRFVTARLLWGS
jgi:hypothetical protein